MMAERTAQNKDIKIFEDQVNQLRVKTKAKLQQTVDDLKADLSQLTLDHHQETDPLNRQISELQAQTRKLQTTVRAKENDHKSKRKLVEKKIEAAQKDLDRFGKTLGGASPALDKEFHCTVCMQTMGPPRQIFQCVNGHLICNICKNKRIQLCPSCRINVANSQWTRNIPMERLVRDHVVGSV